MVQVIRTNSSPAPQHDEAADATLKKLEAASEENVAERLAAKLGFPYIDLSLFPVENSAVTMLPRALAETSQAALFQKEGRTFRIAMLAPSDAERREPLAAFAREKGAEAIFYTVSEASLERAWQEYERQPFVEHLDRMRISLSGEDLAVFEESFGKLLSLQQGNQNIPTSQVIEILLAGADKLRASDVHIEPEGETVRLRYRIDGELADMGHLPVALYRLALSRIKLLAKMKLNIRDRSQDGSFFITEKDARVDIRVSIIPSNHGETINMRLLRAEDTAVALEDLGLRGSAYEEIKRQIKKPHGMIVNTGPTGSGKTTTLYALLREINDPAVKIITVEDPIEYALPGVVQTAANQEDGYAFGEALRAIVRQDPDVILVGEIRDEETAEVAMNAALTGHLVFTTLHTNDAPASIVRLAELGIKGSLIGSAVNIFIGQRLVRTLCQECKTSYVPAKRTVAALKKILARIPRDAGVPIPEDIPVLYKPGSCPACHFSGYRGRKGIFEIFPVTESIAAIINGFAAENEIRAAAKREGMVTMDQDGLLKVIDGVTTFQEVWSNAGQEEALESLYQDILADPGVQAAEPSAKPSSAAVA